MYHISVPPKHLTIKSAGCISHVVSVVTFLILNHIGRGWLHNVSCDWSILKIHFYKMESCYSWAAALITNQTVPHICRNINRYCHMDHVNQLVTTFAILVESTHPMRRWQKIMNPSESFTPAWSPDSTAHQYLSWTLIQTWFITVNQ